MKIMTRNYVYNRKNIYLYILYKIWLFIARLTHKLLLRTSVCQMPTEVRLVPALISGFWRRFEDGDS